MSREDFARTFYASQDQEARQWIEQLLGETTNASASFYDILKDGVLLGRVISFIDPKWTRKIHMHPRSMMQEIENIDFFIQSCQEQGLKTIFNSLDLHEQKNMRLVTATLHDFARLSNRLHPDRVPPIIPTNFESGSSSSSSSSSSSTREPSPSLPGAGAGAGAAPSSSSPSSSSSSSGTTSPQKALLPMDRPRTPPKKPTTSQAQQQPRASPLAPARDGSPKAPPRPVRNVSVPSIPSASLPPSSPVPPAVSVPTVAKPQTPPKPAARPPKVEPRPVSVPKPEPEPIVEPVVEPVVEPAVEPIVEPEPVSEPEPVVEPVPEPESRAIPEETDEKEETIVEEPEAVEPVVVPEPEPEPVPEPVPEPEADQKAPEDEPEEKKEEAEKKEPVEEKTATTPPKKEAPPMKHAISMGILPSMQASVPAPQDQDLKSLPTVSPRGFRSQEKKTGSTSTSSVSRKDQKTKTLAHLPDLSAPRSPSRREKRPKGESVSPREGSPSPRKEKTQLPATPATPKSPLHSSPSSPDLLTKPVISSDVTPQVSIPASVAPRSPIPVVSIPSVSIPSASIPISSIPSVSVPQVHSPIPVISIPGFKPQPIKEEPKEEPKETPASNVSAGNSPNRIDDDILKALIESSPGISPAHPQTFDSEEASTKQKEQDPIESLQQKLASEMDDEIMNSLSNYEKMISSSTQETPTQTQIQIRETDPNHWDQMREDEDLKPRERRNTNALRQELAAVEAQLDEKKIKRTSSTIQVDTKDVSTTKKLKKKFSGLSSPTVSKLTRGGTKERRAKSNSTNDPAYLANDPHIPDQHDDSLSSPKSSSSSSSSLLSSSSSSSSSNLSGSSGSHQTEQHRLAEEIALLEKKEKLRMELRQAKDENRRRGAETREQKQRINVLLEISNTEEDYIRDLNIIIRMDEVLAQENVLSAQERNTLFSNVRQIIAMHVELQSQLEQQLSSAPDNECWMTSVGPVFLRLGGFLKMYVTYISGQEAQNHLTEHLFSHSNSFVSTLVKNIPELGGSKMTCRNMLQGYLIRPIQRVCKYPLLLRELIRNTDDDHPDLANLRKAMAGVEETTSFINQRKREAENLSKILEIQRAVSEIPKNVKLSEGNRAYIREGDLIKVSKGRAQERYFFLFDDMLMWTAKSVVKGNKLVFRGRVFLTLLLVNDLPDSAGRKNAFELIRVDHKKKKYIICTKDPEEKQIWMNEIAQLVTKYLKDEKQAEKRKKDALENLDNLSADELIQAIRTQSELLERLEEEVAASERTEEQQHRIEEITARLKLMKTKFAKGDQTS